MFVLARIRRYNPATAVMKRRREAETSKDRPGRGRPPVHKESWSKVSVVLFDRQIAHLDAHHGVRRGQKGKPLNRAEIIRALIDALIESGMDISAASSEADLRARVARRLATPFR